MIRIEEIMENSIYIILLLTTYIFRKTNVINNLILIEFIAISITIVLFKILINTEIENFIILYFITLIICERIVGLSIIIAIIRTHGNTQVKSLNIIKF